MKIARAGHISMSKSLSTKCLNLSKTDVKGCIPLRERNGHPSLGMNGRLTVKWLLRGKGIHQVVVTVILR